MKRDGLENVHTEPVMVPTWVRGHESAEVVEPSPQQIHMLGLGGSVATPADGVEGQVLVVGSDRDLDARALQARRRIVLFNVPFTSYVETLRYRTNGAARHGAVAMLVRSIAPDGQRLPHTRVLQYSSGVPKIPAAAIASEDADLLQPMADRGPVVVRLKMEEHFEPEALSANVVGEIRGRECPNEFVVIGGHLDSWDVVTGASDDVGGYIVTWEALRAGMSH